MQLKLLPDEALDSFVSRNFVFTQRWKDTSINKWFGFERAGHWTLAKLSSLSEMLGFDSVYGTSYLLHNHTGYYRLVFVLNGFDTSYSPKKHCAREVREVCARAVAKLCPVCVHNDYSELGFIYWRRTHQSFDMEICSQHNVKLVSACGGCAKPFLISRHFLEAPWSACECGFSVFDLKLEVNTDLVELKLSKFAHDMHSYEYQLDHDQLANSLKERLKDIGLNVPGNIKSSFEGLMSPIHYDIFFFNLLSIYANRRIYSWGLAYVLSAIFKNFDEFKSFVVDNDVKRCHIFEGFTKYGDHSTGGLYASPSYSAYSSQTPSKLSVAI